MSESSLPYTIQRIRTFNDDAQKAKAQNQSTSFVPVTDVPQNETQSVLESTDTTHANTSNTPIPNTRQITKKIPSKLTIAKEIIDHSAIPYRQSILTDDTLFSDEHALEGGKIITDTKRNRFKLFPAIVAAFTGSVNKTVTDYKVRQSGPTVAKAEERIAVIKKAVEKSVQAPREDFSQIAKKLQTAPRTPTTSSITILKKEALETPSWSHIANEEKEMFERTDETQDLLRTSEPVDTEYVENTSVNQTQEIETSLPTEVETVSFAQEADVTPQVAQETISQEQNTKPQMAVINQTYSQRIPEPTPQPQEAFIRPLPKSTRSIPKLTTPPRVQRTIGSWLPSMTLVGVLFFACVSGVSVTYYVFSLRTVEKVVPVYNPPLQIRTTQATTFILPTNKIETFATINKILTETTGVVQVYPTIATTDGQNKPANATEILNSLALSMPEMLTRSIKEITFGGVDGTTPFILISGSNFETLFAGMLKWEPTISQDLSPLFATTSETPNTFSDAIAYNKSIRVLSTRTGEDQLVYTFVNQNTVVITVHRKALPAILPVIR
jgi:hypothetical protein